MPLHTEKYFWDFADVANCLMSQQNGCTTVELHSKIAYAFLTNSLTHLFCNEFFYLYILYKWGGFSYCSSMENPANMYLGCIA